MTTLSEAVQAWIGIDLCDCGGDHVTRDHDAEAALDDDADAYFDRDDD